MVARSPNAKPDRQTAAALAAAAALNPALVRETLKKVDRCMARLQELQYTVAGGAKVVSGVSLSPRSTRGYLRTSLRCKQETVRMRGGASAQKRSPNGKFGGAVRGEGAQWARMSLPAMLLGETVLEIVQASQFARDIVAVADNAGVTSREPKTPKPVPRTRSAAAAPTAEGTPLRARRAREKQSQRGGGGAARVADAATPPSRARVRARIQFRPVSPLGHGGPLGGRPSVSANRVSPKNRPWAKKAVMFPNPAFHASTSAASPSPSKKQKRPTKTRSPVNNARQTPHKFVIKSPPSTLGCKLRSQGKALPAVSPPPPVKVQPSPAKTRRCSFSPSRLATRPVSPIKARLSLNRSRDSGIGFGAGPMSGLKQRPGVNLTVRTVSSRISSNR